MKQQTIQKAVSVEGVGLHSGASVKLTFHPAGDDHGVKFQRSDLPGSPVIHADVGRVVNTARSTTLKSGDASISTVEHVLAALTGLGIDNVLIEIDGPETPILDGSSIGFVAALHTAGIVTQDTDREYFIVEEPIVYRDEETGTELMALPHEGFEVVTLIDFGSPILGMQYATLKQIEDFEQEIAPCRTFVFLRELEMLFEHNLIKGGDLNNAIVIADHAVPQEQLDSLAQKLGKPRISFDGKGIMNNLELHFQNEPARHKLLDVVGDISLLGRQIKGRILATKPGHKSNVAFTKLLKQAYLEQRKLGGKPRYNPNEEPLFDAVKIAQWLPHRYPFLLVDKIIALSETQVVGIKNITFNEEFFQGHFPNNPVMPGVLQIEAMAQTGGILALSTVEDPGNWDTYFLKIENAKFKNKVVPGDTVILKMELMAPIRRGICQMQGTCYVGNKIVSEAELTAQIVKRQVNE